MSDAYTKLLDQLDKTWHKLTPIEQEKIMERFQSEMVSVPAPPPNTARGPRIGIERP